MECQIKLEETERFGPIKQSVKWTPELDQILVEIAFKHKAHLTTDIPKSAKWMSISQELFNNNHFKAFNPCNVSPRFYKLWRLCNSNFTSKGKLPDASNVAYRIINKMILAAHEAKEGRDAALITPIDGDNITNAAREGKSTGEKDSTTAIPIVSNTKKSQPIPTIETCPKKLKTEKSTLEIPTLRKEVSAVESEDFEEGKIQFFKDEPNLEIDNIRKNPIRIDLLQKNITFFESRLQSGMFRDTAEKQKIQEKVSKWTSELLSL